MKKLTKYRSRFCGCIRNSEKTAPKVPPNLLMLCTGLKVMKEARYRNESDTIGIAVVDLSTLEKISSF